MTSVFFKRNIAGCYVGRYIAGCESDYTNLSYDITRLILLNGCYNNKLIKVIIYNRWRDLVEIAVNGNPVNTRAYIAYWFGDSSLFTDVFTSDTIKSAINGACYGGHDKLLGGLIIRAKQQFGICKRSQFQTGYFAMIYKAFQSACLGGQIATVKKILDIGEVTILTAGMLAVASGHLRIVQAVYARCYPIRQTEKNEQLTEACRLGFVDIAEWLIMQGADSCATCAGRLHEFTD